MTIINHKFLTYHPYLTFSDSRNTRFVEPTGKGGKELDIDTQALFRIGRAAFEGLPTTESKEAFDEYFLQYSEFIDTHRILWRAVEHLEKLELKSNGTELKVDWNSVHDRQILGVVWLMLSKCGASAEALVKEQYKVIFLFHALLEIDNAIISLNLGGNGALSAGIEATNALSNALAIELGSARLQEARRDLAYRGAAARIEGDPKQKEKIFIFECWQKWQQARSTYASKAAFARDMLTKCEHLTSQKNIEDWCREWEAHDRIEQAK